MQPLSMMISEAHLKNNLDRPITDNDIKDKGGALKTQCTAFCVINMKLSIKYLPTVKMKRSAHTSPCGGAALSNKQKEPPKRLKVQRKVKYFAYAKCEITAPRS